MNAWRCKARCLLAIGMVMLCAGSLARADEPAADEGPEQRELPFVELNVEEKYVELEGEICLDAGLLELVATVMHGKEHEAVVAVKARPQHVHLALLLLNLEKGRPGSWEYVDGEPRPIEPKGDPIRVTLIYEDEEGERVERSIADFVEQAGTGDPLPGDVFLFAGSHIEDPPEADPYYVADMTGELIALVSFNGEVLAWPRPASHANEQLHWQVNEEAVPELGTKVTLRLTPVEDWQGPEELPDHTEVEPPETDTPAPGEGEQEGPPL